MTLVCLSNVVWVLPPNGEGSGCFNKCLVNPQGKAFANFAHGAVMTLAQLAVPWRYQMISDGQQQYFLGRSAEYPAIISLADEWGAPPNPSRSL